MPTAFRLQKTDLCAIVGTLKPELAEGEQLAEHDIDRLRVIITEWLLLNGFSSLHNFVTDPNGRWIHPKESNCDCCWRFRVGRRRDPIPAIDGPFPTFVDMSTSTREQQMLYFRGPWIVEAEPGKGKKKKYRVRSHLLETSYEKSVYEHRI